MIIKLDQSLIILLSVVNIHGFQSNPDWDCGEVCNDMCFTYYMEDCTNTRCQFDDDDAGQKWMCLGEPKNPILGINGSAYLLKYCSLILFY